MDEVQKGLPTRLLAVSNQLREIAREYRDLTFTAEQEAMTWPLAIMADDDRVVQVWCAKDDCPLDGHNSLVADVDGVDVTVADLLAAVVQHVAYSKDRMEDL